MLIFVLLWTPAGTLTHAKFYILGVFLQYFQTDEGLVEWALERKVFIVAKYFDVQPVSYQKIFMAFTRYMYLKNTTHNPQSAAV